MSLTRVASPATRWLLQLLHKEGQLLHKGRVASLWRLLRSGVDAYRSSRRPPTRSSGGVWDSTRGYHHARVSSDVLTGLPDGLGRLLRLPPAHQQRPSGFTRGRCRSTSTSSGSRTSRPLTQREGHSTRRIDVHHKVCQCISTRRCDRSQDRRVD